MCKVMRYYHNPIINVTMMTSNIERRTKLPFCCCCCSCRRYNEGQDDIKNDTAIEIRIKTPTMIRNHTNGFEKMTTRL